MYQGDSNVFIEKEIEVGLADGVDIRPYISDGMTGKEVRDLRMSLWAQSVNNGELNDIVIRESCEPIIVKDKKRIFFVNDVEVKGACPINVAGCSNEELVITGRHGVKVKLINTVGLNPVIGPGTNTGMSYGRFTSGSSKLKKLIVDGVKVFAETVTENFYLGRFGDAEYFEVELKNGGELFVPEMRGIRVMRWGNYCPYGSTKCIEPAKYEIDLTSDSYEEAVRKLRITPNQQRYYDDKLKEGVVIPDCLRHPCISIVSVGNTISCLRAGLDTNLLISHATSFNRKRLHWLLYASELDIPLSDLEKWDKNSLGGFLLEDGILRYAAKKLGITGYNENTNLEKEFAHRYDINFGNGILTEETKKILWCCICAVSITGFIDEDLERWFEYWRKIND